MGDIPLGIAEGISLEIPEGDIPDLSNQTIRDYEVICRRGQGASSVIYLVRHRMENKEYAMKILSLSDQNAQRFVQEQTAFQVLSQEPSCSDIVVCLKEAFLHVIEVEENGMLMDRREYYVLVTELMISDLFELFFSSLCRLPQPWTLVDLMLDLLDGLVEIHAKGMAHNDIKLANIFYSYYRWDPTEQIEKLEVKYGDLGFACTDERHLPSLGEGEFQMCSYDRGSPFSVSPEQARTLVNQQAEIEIPLESAQKSDVWALGVAFRLLSNNTYPFPSITQVSHLPSFRDLEHMPWIFRVIAAEEIEPFEYNSGDPTLDWIVTNTITHMTWPNPEDRPTAKEAFENLLSNLRTGGILEEEENEIMIE